MKKHEKKARSLAAMCCFFLSLIALLVNVGEVKSQIMTVSPTTSSLCGSPTRCCYHFKFEVSATTDYLEIDVDNDGCWDWTCFLNQTFVVTTQGGAVTVTANHTAPTPPNTRGKIQLSFSAALTPSPAQVEFVLCPDDGPPPCNPINLTYDWISKNGGTQNGSGDGTFNACAGSQIDCKGCDQTVIYRINDCIHDVCYKRRSSSGTTGSIRFEFVPPLAACGSPASGCSTTTIAIPSGYTATYTYDDPPTNSIIKYVTLDPGPTTAACDLVCITVPVCNRTNGGAGYTVKATEPGSPNDCGDYPEYFFKKSPQGFISLDNTQHGNYPNPVSSSSDFKTTIPFTLNADADARIKIFDASGELVHSETESFSGAGKHFFYFTGKDLPTGTYYYMIEAPLGAVIVQKTLLIVK